MSLSMRHGKPLIPQGPRFRSRLSRRLATGMESAKTSRGEGTAQDPRAKSLIRLASQAATYRTGPRTRRAKSRPPIAVMAEGDRPLADGGPDPAPDRLQAEGALMACGPSTTKRHEKFFSLCSNFYPHFFPHNASS